MTIPELYSKFLKLNIDKIEVDAIMGSKESIIDAIVNDQQYEKGIKGDGQSIGRYSRKTIPIKVARGQRIDHITLRDEGNFHKGYTMERAGYGGLVYSRDSKADMLEGRYGSGINDLTNQNQSKIVESEIKPAFLKGLRNGLQL